MEEKLKTALVDVLSIIFMEFSPEDFDDEARATLDSARALVDDQFPYWENDKD